MRGLWIALIHIKMAMLQELPERSESDVLIWSYFNLSNHLYISLLGSCQIRDFQIPEKDKILSLIDKAIEIDNKSPIG